MDISAELEEALRDGGDEALTLVLHEAIKRNDVPMIARMMKMLNARIDLIKSIATAGNLSDQTKLEQIERISSAHRERDDV